jgi:hypothetical protein
LMQLSGSVLSTAQERGMNMCIPPAPSKKTAHKIPPTPSHRHGPEWQGAMHLWLLHPKRRPQTSVHGGHAAPPSQQRRRQACRPQARIAEQRDSHASSALHGSSFSTRPQRHALTTKIRQVALQSPAWHLSAHAWPHGKGLPHVEAQVGARSPQRKSGNSPRPHGHVRRPATGQPPQSLAQQTRSHLCRPQPSSWPWTRAHLKSRSLHGATRASAPQRQRCSTWTAHGAHGPA